MIVTKKQLCVACGRDVLSIERVVPEGKKEMDIAAFLNGSGLRLGDLLLDGLASDSVDKL